MSSIMALPSALPAAQCIPSNDLLSGPLGGVIDKLSGAFGGLVMPLAIMMVLLLAVIFLVTVLTKSASRFLKAGGVVVGAVLGLPLLILIVASLFALFNNAC